MSVGRRTQTDRIPAPIWSEWQDVRSASGDTLKSLADWFEGYVMQPHLDVGRSGHVCPYMAPSARQNLARLTVNEAMPGDRQALRRTLTAGVELYGSITCPEAKAVFRTVVIAYPTHSGEEAVAELQWLQRSMRFRAARQGLMIGLFEPDSAQPGIVNRSFRSFRSPIAVIAIRTMVEGDAPFVLRNPLMIPVYLSRFGATGWKRLLRAAKKRFRDRFGGLWGATEPA
ncbi:MAG: hypothetical protein K2Y56_16750 [Methylobacterium sp.]|uniref:DUF6875 domain-containing protein n=1 Tax=Methylobacterium sp. TaxID=409 RepID=UPI0025E4775A|nr:hypothetical protein [Methylobacterium sp.]MBX9933159.1 hypothetical protein [Methylobacterium sp.]